MHLSHSHMCPFPLQIKVAMLDSANETIASLKAELSDTQVGGRGRQSG
jgi:hypothetical protein